MKNVFKFIVLLLRTNATDTNWKTNGLDGKFIARRQIRFQSNKDAQFDCYFLRWILTTRVLCRLKLIKLNLKSPKLCRWLRVTKVRIKTNYFFCSVFQSIFSTLNILTRPIKRHFQSHKIVHAPWFLRNRVSIATAINLNGAADDRKAMLRKLKFIALP